MYYVLVGAHNNTVRLRVRRGFYRLCTNRKSAGALSLSQHEQCRVWNSTCTTKQFAADFKKHLKSLLFTNY